MGMLSAYSYERNILTSATRLMKNDAFRAVSQLSTKRRQAKPAKDCTRGPRRTDAAGKHGVRRGDRVALGPSPKSLLV